MEILKKQGKSILLEDELFVFCWPRAIIYVKFREILEEINFSTMEMLFFSILKAEENYLIFGKIHKYFWVFQTCNALDSL